MENDENTQEFLLEEEEGDESTPTEEETVTISRNEYGKLTRLAKKAKRPAPPQTQITNREVVRPDLLEDEVLDLRFEGHTKDDIKFILANGGKKALEDQNSLVSLAIKARREQRDAENAAAKANGTSGESEILRKFTQAEMETMTAEEMEKHLPHA